MFPYSNTPDSNEWSLSGGLVFITVFSIRVLQVYNVFPDISGLVAAGSQLAHVSALQAIGKAHAVWEFARPFTLAGKQLQHCIWCWRTLHPLDGQLPVIISGPSTTFGTWNIGLALKTAPPNSSLVVCTEDVHEEAVFTWWKLTGLYLSPCGTEQLMSEFIDFRGVGRRHIHVAGDLLQLLKELGGYFP